MADTRPDLVPEEVRRLEREKLDVCWETQAAFLVPSRDALRGLLGAGTRAMNSARSEGAPAGILQVHDQIRRWLGGLRWGVSWILRPGRTTSGRSCTGADFDRALRLGADFEDVADLLKMCGKGTATARVLDEGGTVEFAHVARDVEAATLDPYFAGETLRPRAARTPDKNELRALRRCVRGGDFIAALESRAARRIGACLRNSGDALLPEDWSLGTYTLGEAETAWSTICSVAATASMASVEEPLLEVFAVSQSGLARAMARYFGGGVAAAREWIADLAAGSGGRPVNITLTPFFPIDGETIWASTGQLSVYNHQRNLIKCVARRRPKAWDSLKDKKEALFRSEIRAVVAPLGWQVYDGHVMRDKGRVIGDIDAFVADTTGGVMLAELKWPIGADEIHEVEQDFNELRIGCEQVVRARAWALENWTTLQDRMPGLPPLPEAQVRTAVISRTTFPSERAAAAGLEDVVVAAFDWLRAIVAEDRPRDVHDLHARLATPPRMRDSGFDVEHAWVILRLGGINWRLPAASIGPHAG